MTRHLAAGKDLILVKTITDFCRFCYPNIPCLRMNITLIFMSSSSEEFTRRKTQKQMFLLFSGGHICAPERDCFLTWVKTENCRVSFVTFSCCVSIVVPFLVCINIDSFGVIICYNLVTGNTQPKIFFPLFSRNENQGKLRVCFKLQVGNPWTNLAEIWPTYCQIVFLKNCVCEFWFLFSFSSKSIFFHR